jgi:hypothetical protein
LCLTLLALTVASQADTLSFTGALASPTDTFQLTFNLPAATTVTVQTYGFGGGVNASGHVIAPGGFDPLLALFDGAGEIIDGTSDTLLNYYTNPSFQGCPPAGMVTIGTGVGSSVCGDIFMSFTLVAGTYTLVLADANYQPNALIAPGSTNLADGFTDFTGGAFQTCNFPSGGIACITPTNNWAFDITGVVPEPATLSLFVGGLAAGWWRRKRSSF